MNFVLTLCLILITNALLYREMCQLCSHSSTSQHFMKPENSIPCSEESSVGPYPEPYQTNLHHPILSLQDPFQYCPPTYSWSSQWYISFWISHQYPICISLLHIRATCPVQLIVLIICSNENSKINNERS
jgi:hypothetical protein